MQTGIEIIIGRLQGWVKSTYLEIKSIDKRLDAMSKVVSENYKELVKEDSRQHALIIEILANRANCDSNFASIMETVKEYGKKIPSDYEIEDKKEKDKRNTTMWNKMLYITGWVSGTAFLFALIGSSTAIVISALKHFWN